METCLSAGVKFILCDVYEQTDHYCPDVLDDHGLLQWNIIKMILPDAPTVGEEDRDYLVSCVQALSPALRTVHQHYLDISEDSIHRYLLWMSEPEAIKRSIQLARMDTRIGIIHALLLCTSVMEHSLGDLYLLKGKQCPSMLKDLLVTNELRQVLGYLPLRVLRIMIGPPISLNLRNILWHGFPSPGEIRPQYLYLLVAVMASVGKIIQDSHISPCQIQHRPIATFPQIGIIEQALFKDIENEALDLDSIRELFKETTFVQKSMVDIWTNALHMYKIGRYGDCVCLLLPQLEHGLRRIFTIVNNCPHRMLTAESTVLFTTLDEILSPSLEDGTENKLRYHLGEKIMMMLLDLFSYPAGPRLRDKVSHGETNINNLSHDVAHVLLAVCIVCMERCRMISYTNQIKPGEPGTIHQNIESSCRRETAHDVGVSDPSVCVSVIDRLMTSVNTYKGYFHPIAVIQSKMVQCAKILENWNKMSAQIQALLDDNVDREEDSPIIEDIFKAGRMWLMKYLKHTILHLEINMRVLEPFCDLLLDYQSYVDHTIPTLYRTAWDKLMTREDEIVGLLHHVTQQSTLVAEQICVVVEEWNSQYETKELRSRQRKTYFRLLQSIPVLSCGLRLVLLVCFVIIYALDHIKLSALSEQLQIVKLLKFMLKYSELLTTYMSSNRNRWKEATDLTVQLSERVCTTVKQENNNECTTSKTVTDSI